VNIKNYNLWKTIDKKGFTLERSVSG
jgi:hypothetical protein